MLASDGLTGMLEDEQVREVLMMSADLEEIVDRLIADANRRGGLDNITVILIKIEEVSPPTGEIPALRA